MTTFTFLAHTAAFSSIAGWSLTLDKNSCCFRKTSTYILTYTWETVLTLGVLALGRKLIIWYLLEDPEHDHLVEEWAELVQEGENDMFSLVMSFLISDVLLFAVTGKQILNASGHESLDSLHGHSSFDVKGAYGLSAVFFLSAFLFGSVMAYFTKEITGHHELQDRIDDLKEEEAWLRAEQRKLDQVKNATKKGAQYCALGFMKALRYFVRKRVSVCIQNTLIMTSVWLFIDATQWAVGRTKVAGKDLTMQNRTALNLMVLCVAAFFATAFIVLVTWANYSVLDKCAHRWAIAATKSLKQLMLGMGFLVGFTLEHSFNTAIGAVASLSPIFDEKTTTVILFTISFAIIYPAWAWYIIPQHTEKGYLFGFLPSTAAKFIKRVLMTEDLDLSNKEKVDYLEHAIVEISKSMTKEQLDHLRGNLKPYEPPQHGASAAF